MLLAMGAYEGECPCAAFATDILQGGQPVCPTAYMLFTVLLTPNGI
jgi:hypothetical protein